MATNLQTPSAELVEHDIFLVKSQCWHEYEQTGNAHWLDAYCHLVDAYQEAKAAIVGSSVEVAA